MSPLYLFYTFTLERLYVSYPKWLIFLSSESAKFLPRCTSCTWFLSALKSTSCTCLRWWWCLATKSCPALLWSHGWGPARLLCPWDFPGKNTGAGCHSLLQGMFPNWDQTCVLLDRTETPGKPKVQIHSCLFLTPLSRHRGFKVLTGKHTSNEK